MSDSNVLSKPTLSTVNNLNKQENKYYVIDDNIALSEGKVQNIKFFQVDMNILMPKQVDPQVQSAKKVKFFQNQGSLQVFIQSQSGKMKILSRPIDFTSLNEGQNIFIEKLDKCPDKEAKIQFQISYQVVQNLKNNQNEKALMIQSNFTSKQTLKGEPQSLITKKNSYLESNLFSNHQLNGFVQKLLKKTVKTFNSQIGRRESSKSTDKNILKLNSMPSLQKNLSNKVQRRESSANKNFFQIKSIVKETNSEIMVQSLFLQTQIDSLKDEIQSKSMMIKTSQNQISALKIKNKSLQNQHKKLLNQNSSLKSSIERLQDKLNLHKEKFQSTLISNENQTDRWLNKQKQYQLNLKNCTQKIATLEYQKQRMKFDHETLKLQAQKNQQTLLSKIQIFKIMHQKQLREVNRQIVETDQRLKQIQKQKSLLANQYEKTIETNNIFKNQLTRNKQQNQVLQDQILRKNVQIQRLNGKLLLFSQSLETQKIITVELESLKLQMNDKQSHIHHLESQMSSLKVAIKDLKINLEKQKSQNQKILCLKNQKETQIKILNLRIISLSEQLQNVIDSYKKLEIKFQQQRSKLDKKVKQQNLRQFQLQQKILRQKKEIQAINLENKSLKQVMLELKKQSSEKFVQIKNIQSEVSQKVQIIDQIIEIINKFQQHLITNEKLTLIISKQNEKSLKVLGQRLTKSRRIQQLPQRIKRSLGVFQDHLNNLIYMSQGLTEKNSTLQKQLISLTSSIQRMHKQTIQESNQLKGSKLTLQEKLHANQCLISKLRLMVDQKDKQILLFNQKLSKEQQNSKYLKQSLQCVTLQLTQKKLKLQESTQTVKKLLEQAKSLQLIHRQVEHTLKQKLSYIESQFQEYKTKQISLNKTKSLEMNDLNKKYQHENHHVQKLSSQISQLKSLLTTNKIQVQRVTTLFVDIYRQINNIEKQSNLSSFLFIPLRDAVKKVQVQVFPKISATSSTKGEKERNNLPRTTNNTKSPPHVPQIVKSPSSKLSITSKGSNDKRQRLKTKQSQKP